MTDYTRLKEIHECIYNDNIYCDVECNILCIYHPIHRASSRLYIIKNKQITIEDILNEKEKKDS